MAKKTPIAPLPNDLQEAAEIIAEQNEMIEKLTASAKTGGDALPFVQIDGISYKIISGAKFKGQNYSREDLAKDIELVKLLIKLGSSIIKKEV
jgi:hypothetical protein